MLLDQPQDVPGSEYHKCSSISPGDIPRHGSSTASKSNLQQPGPPAQLTDPSGGLGLRNLNDHISQVSIGQTSAGACTSSGHLGHTIPNNGSFPGDGSTYKSGSHADYQSQAYSAQQVWLLSGSLKCSHLAELE